jgi:hypothetical protein
MFVDFLLQRRAALKNNKSYADERINTEMKSLSIPCVGGRGQPMLAGGNGGGGGEQKKSTINRTLQCITSRFIFVDKNARNKMKKL